MRDRLNWLKSYVEWRDLGINGVEPWGSCIRIITFDSFHLHILGVGQRHSKPCAWDTGSARPKHI
jgi:hypothetical protein